MKRFNGWMLSVLFLFGLASTQVQATTVALPLIISATVNYSAATLTIAGHNFRSGAVVTLDGLNFPVVSGSTGTQVVANFPTNARPSTFAPGTYFLTVAFKNQLPMIFAVDIGSTGAQGPAVLPVQQARRVSKASRVWRDRRARRVCQA